MTNKLNIKLMKFSLKEFLWFLVCLFSSFDVALNLRIGGFSLRFVYIIILVSGLIYLIENIQRGKLYIRIVGFWYFIIWVFFLVIFIPNTPLLGRNIGYLVWLIIHFAYIAVVSYGCDSKEKLNRYVKLYLLSFSLLSLFGLLQLSLGLMGVDLFVEQWWIIGRFPRLNGLSYEPSYYATYLISGFSTAYYLFRKKTPYWGSFPKYTCLLTAIAIILSTSRMGILLVVIEIIIFELIFNRGSLKTRIAIISTIAVLILTVSVITVKTDLLSFLFVGLGIMGGPAHSSLERLDGFLTQFDIFQKNIIKGYSLGGVSQVIALERGETILSQEIMKAHDASINIFMEVLTASGIFGFTFFLLYVVRLLKKTFKNSDTSNLSSMSEFLTTSLAWGLIFELIILCFNQNILRPYLWTHIAILNAAYFSSRTLK